jgi:hypothetical protein
VEVRRIRIIIIKIIIRNGAKTISLQTLFGRLDYLMRLRDMKYIGFKHQRENEQNSDDILYFLRLYTEFFIILYVNTKYYISLKIKPNSVRIRFLSCQICILPSTVFELTPLIHCSTNRLALCKAP